MMKRFFCVLLAVCMACALFPCGFAAEYSGYDYASGELGARLDKIIHEGITDVVSPELGPVDTSMDRNQTYTISFPETGGSYQGKQCFAYAMAAYSALFGYKCNGTEGNVRFDDLIGASSLSYEALKEAGVRCGAYLRVSTPSAIAANDPNSTGHSLLILAYNESGITALEGNYSGNGVPNGIALHTRSWAEFNRQNFEGLYCGPCVVADLNQPTAEVYAKLESTVTLAASGSTMSGMHNFILSERWTDETFQDVGNKWYLNAVSQVYNYGLMKGKSETAFDPEGNVTLSEAIAVACNIRSTYLADGMNFKNTGAGTWYKKYVAYALEKGIIAEGEFDNYGDVATRAEFAHILANALPSEEYEEIAEVESIPDMTPNDEYYMDIYMLYCAGILTGNASGAFSPNDSISRAAAASIIVKTVNPSVRAK